MVWSWGYRVCGLGDVFKVGNLGCVFLYLSGSGCVRIQTIHVFGAQTCYLLNSVLFDGGGVLGIELRGQVLYHLC